MKKLLIVLLCLITAGSLGVTVYLLLRDDKKPEPSDKTNVYPAVSHDPGAEKIPPVSSVAPLSNPPGGGAVSLSYSTKLSAPKGNGVAQMMFQNPAQSNQSIVLQLHMTDKALLEKLGKTGRTASEKAKIETASGYNPETSRVTIAESGLLAPGYKLSKLQLKALPDGTVLPAGTYSAVYYILAYDKVTNERAIVNMQIPVTLTVGE